MSGVMGRTISQSPSPTSNPVAVVALLWRVCLARSIRVAADIMKFYKCPSNMETLVCIGQNNHVKLVWLLANGLCAKVTFYQPR